MRSIYTELTQKKSPVITLSIPSASYSYSGLLITVSHYISIEYVTGVWVDNVVEKVGVWVGGKEEEGAEQEDCFVGTAASWDESELLVGGMEIIKEDGESDDDDDDDDEDECTPDVNTDPSLSPTLSNPITKPSKTTTTTTKPRKSLGLIPSITSRSPSLSKFSDLMDALNRSYADLHCVKKYAVGRGKVGFVEILTPGEYKDAVGGCDNEWDKLSASGILAEAMYPNFTCGHLATLSKQLKGNTKWDVVNGNVRKCGDWEVNWKMVWDTLEEFDKIVCEDKCKPPGATG